MENGRGAHAHDHERNGVNYGGPDGSRDPNIPNGNDVGTDSSDSEPEGFDDCDCAEVETLKLDRIPYVAVYEDKDTVEVRGHYIPGAAVNAEIIEAMRDQGGIHLTSPYIYTINVKHGPYDYNIQRRYTDFQRLHNSLSRFRRASKLAAFFSKGNRPEACVLSLSHMGEIGLIEIGKDESLEDAMKNHSTLKKRESNLIRGPGAQYQKSIDGEDEQVEFRRTSLSQGTSRRDQRESVLSVGHDQKRRQSRSQARHNRLPHFPRMPDSVIGEDGLEERRMQLQRYLISVLHVHAYRNHKETQEFLEISRLSFVHNLGHKFKEDMVKRRPGGAYSKGKVRNFCITRCYRWRQSWLVLKDTFLTYVDPKTEKIGDVLLFDRLFQVRTHDDRVAETKGVRRGLHVTNMQRDLLLKTFNFDQASIWKAEIEKVLHGPGNIWTLAHPNGSTFPVRQNVYGQWFTDGRPFMEHAANMMEIAKEEIFITDWWLNPQIFLKRPAKDDRWRLDEILKRKAEEGVRVFIVVYREISQVLALGSQQMEQYLTSLNPNIRVLRHPDHVLAGVVSFSHHEKLIVIDQNIAFVGGIDLCYGRWDDHEHRLTDLGGLEKCSMEDLGIDVEKMKQDYKDEISPPGTPEARLKSAAGTSHINPVFNNQSEAEVGKSEKTDFFEILRQKQLKMESNMGHNLWREKLKCLKEKINDESRELWMGKDYGNSLCKDLPEPEKAFDDFVDRSVIPRMPWHDISSVVYGTAARDVARHFIQRWNQAKYDLATRDTKYDDYPSLLPKSYENVGVPPIFRKMAFPCKIQIVRSSSTWSAGLKETEASVTEAYQRMIAEAEHYIYIENQFFVSQVGNPDLKNKIAQSLFDRIVRAHKNKETFRVYVLMPLLPGFTKTSGSMQMVLHWTCTSISKGPKSLLENLKNTIGDYSEYIVFCGLRNYGVLLGKLVTELVYIHSKLIIVDDRKCLIGSANINDRSQLGDRDSEVCVIFEDSQFTPSTMNGQPYKAGVLTGSLRRRLFQEHMGMLHDGGQEEAKVHRVDLIDVNDPTSPEFWSLFHEIAKRNTDIYDEVFKCAPSDELLTLDQWAKREAETTSKATTDKEGSMAKLQGVHGHLVEFPLKFLSQSDLMKDRFVPESLMPAYTFN